MNKEKLMRISYYNKRKLFVIKETPFFQQNQVIIENLSNQHFKCRFGGVWVQNGQRFMCL